MADAKVLKEFLGEVKPAIDAYILDFLPSEHSRDEVQCLYDMMRDYPQRSGKRLRPALCLLICEAFGGDPEKAFNTAAALELLQNWLLIHDDIEDGSDLRRGEPCLNQKYGVPLALNAGDALHCKMWEMLHRNAEILGHEVAFQVLAEFTRLSNQVVEGQHVELSWVHNNQWNLTEGDYWTMCVQKTAWYTSIAPCRLGAITAGAAKADVDQFIDIGQNLGVAFQIQDDVLNLTGDEGQYGKEIAGDISEGKRTLVLIHLVNSCTADEADSVVEIMARSRNNKSTADINEVLSLMEKYQSIAYAQKRSEALVEQACAQFAQRFVHIPDNQAKNLFVPLVRFVVERDY
ncbi:MAG: polyprenyl synthetase family protein [Candidatus Poribacteria bacterium]|nr:polyprenyl synthetase family protein [Candidatus Poribacteria bacterium]MDE0504907.1 polyprenyl synthetase family protein [Candidatus Poribacteria bacterium]